MKRLLADPLVQFLGLGALLFAIYGVLAPANQGVQDEVIVVSRAQVNQLSAVFERTWQRPPTQYELNSLIDSYIREEAYVREALALGLDNSDSVIRRRLQQKLEFITDAQAERLAPSDADLETFLVEHSENYRTEHRIAFDQVFLGAGKVTPAHQVQELLSHLTKHPDADRSSLGVATMLPAEMPLSAASSVARNFGSDFVQAILTLPVGTWSGPVMSSYGPHLVRITSRTSAVAPALEEIRDAVLRDWTSQKRKEIAAEYDAALLKKYEVVLEPQVTGDPAANP